MSIRGDLYNFLRERVGSISDEANTCFGVEVLDTQSESSESDFGILFGDCISSLAPNRGATQMVRFDVETTIVAYAFIGDDEQERAAARDRAEAMGLEISLWMHLDMTMGGRVRNSRALDLIDGYVDGARGLYAVSNIPVRINETGKSDNNERQ